MPPLFSLSGIEGFEGAIHNDATPGLPEIQVSRLVEEGDVVVAEGAVHKICRLVTTRWTGPPRDSARRAWEG